MYLWSPIRKLIKNKFWEQISEEISILYGGSYNPGNIKEICRKKDVDKGCFRGSSLKEKYFEKNYLSCLIPV